MIKVACKIKNYYDEQPKEEELITDIFVESHWNRPEMVILMVEGKRVMVVAKDLKAAIDNCVNTNRY